MKKIMIAAAALVAMTACNKTLIESPIADSEYGYINFGLSSDMEIVDTKAQTTVEKTNSTYNVYLKKDGVDQWINGEIKYKEYSAITTADLKVAAATNAYVIEAENYTEAEAESVNNGYGAVRVKGASAAFTVKAGETTEMVTVQCTPVNAKVTVGFAEDFLSVFTNAEVTLIDGNRKLLMTPATVTKEVVETSETYTHTAVETTSVAYFNVDNGVLSWSIKATVGGSVKTYTNTFAVEANKWNMITFKAGKDGNIVFSITAETGITDPKPITPEVDPLNPSNNN
jgi:hypothetical protein